MASAVSADVVMRTTRAAWANQTDFRVPRRQGRDAAHEQADDGQRTEGRLFVQVQRTRPQVGRHADGAGDVPGAIQTWRPPMGAAERFRTRGQGIPDETDSPYQVVDLRPPSKAS